MISTQTNVYEQLGMNSQHKWQHYSLNQWVITVRHYDSAVYAMAPCVAVCVRVTFSPTLVLLVMLRHLLQAYTVDCVTSTL